MKIAVVGTGYVGLVTGTCLAEVGNHVTCIDIDKDKIAMMRAGKIPIYEPGLRNVFQRNLDEGRLEFSTELSDGIKDAKVIFLALPTPPNGNGSADLSFILGVAKKLSNLLGHYTVVVNKSTVPVGTAERVSKIIAKNAKVKIDVVSNPEFLREGFAVNDFMKPDRIIIGATSFKARALMNELYRPFVSEGGEIFFMDERSAEVTKYAANSFLAAKITFMNEVANLCEHVGADVDCVRRGIGSDPRIGKRFLRAGIGYGGSCFPKDVTALYQTAQESGYDFKLIKAVTAVNNLQKRIIIDKVKKYYPVGIKGKTFALWGLAFKPDTDDIREAPALTIINELIKNGASVVAYDPEATAHVRKLYEGTAALTFKDDMYAALGGADALLIATEWGEFRSPDYAQMKARLKEPVIFDGRNLYDLDRMKKTGFYYQSVGRATIKPEG
ncbi:MAG TPA: UDP-glucose/GDP-mannose dehydrogenase family protein [Candidatus Saccharimonadales bacterium]|nr:UDP-glucose/GDP-mannose dehydrogenase family protein [Candidatus Saccharimonadales bacterium]